MEIKETPNIYFYGERIGGCICPDIRCYVYQHLYESTNAYCCSVPDKFIVSFSEYSLVEDNFFRGNIFITSEYRTNSHTLIITGVSLDVLKRCIEKILPHAKFKWKPERGN